MIVESSATHVKSELSRLLIAFRSDEHSSDVSLDVIEFIALRMRERADDQVAEMGFYVRVNLLGFVAGRFSYYEVHDRLVRAALAAPLGHADLREAFGTNLRYG